MELDEIIAQTDQGLKEAFQNHEFSKSWVEFERKYYKQECPPDKEGKKK
jgi:hypothetical protein